MTATLSATRRTTGLPRPDSIRVAREDIWFFDAGADRVRVAVTVRNEGGQYSEPTRLVLQAAPLGAFLSWRPLTTLPLPALEPGESIELSTEVARPRLSPLGDPATVPPRRLLTAVGPGDRPSRPAAPPATRVRRGPLGVRRRLSRLVSDAADAPELPPDPLDLLGRSNPHWAGNINVFIGGRAVERHRAQALRVYAGRTNLAVFCVGTGPDAYAFDLQGEGTAWDAALYDGTSVGSLLIDWTARPAIRQSEWIRTPGPMLVLLAVCPPKDCGMGDLEVHVAQRSTGQTTRVEFSLDPAAAGPGCFTV